MNDKKNAELKNEKEKIIEKKKEKKCKHEHKKGRIGINKKLVRNIDKYLNETFNWRNIFNLDNIKGSIYINLHSCYLFLSCFITFFSTSVYVLIILLTIITLDGVSIVFLQECPITTLESKYLGYNGVDMRDDYLKKLDISYNCYHTYEKQMELIINVWCIIAMKCLCIMFLSMFKIKLLDISKIYTE
jgi:hypothetical protein